LTKKASVDIKEKSPDKVNLKDKWNEINKEWDPIPKETKEQKSDSPTKVYVSQILPNKGGDNSKIRVIKKDAPLFDDPYLHIKKAQNTKNIRIESLNQGPKVEEVVEVNLEENLTKEKHEKRVKQLEEKKQQLKQEQIEKMKTLTKKPTTQPMQEDQLTNDKEKVFETKREVQTNGQRFNVEKKIFKGEDENFVFTLTVPDKMTKRSLYQDEEKDQDPRIAQLKKKFDKKVAEKSIYTGPELGGGIDFIENQPKQVKEENPQNLKLSAENNMAMNVNMKQPNTNNINKNNSNIKSNPIHNKSSSHDLNNNAKNFFISSQ